MIRWVNSSLQGVAFEEDMVAFECVTVANQDCYSEVLRDCVLHQGYDVLSCA